MSKSVKGTKENPWVNVRVKSELNREILSNGWGEFRNMLKYKQEYSGEKLVAVNPVNTSRKCSNCKIIDKNSRGFYTMVFMYSLRTRNTRWYKCGYKYSSGSNESP